jgi:succinate dehydrogenase/fumarate reductase flavoprotein subunit
MRHSLITIGGREVPVVSVQTVVVGTGAAALNCAVWLDRLGCSDVLLLTDRVGGGTSANTGSDKQTYYKLSQAGATPDSPLELAHSLFDGGAMHGDIALVEATASAQCFYQLVSLGVPFPHDRWGGYTGYRTDHDTRGRATSAGPKTSQMMVAALHAEAERRGMPVRAGLQVIGILTTEGDAREGRRPRRPKASEEGDPRGHGPSRRAIGLVCLDTAKLEEPGNGLTLVNAVNIIDGTGGPAQLYRDSVYPEAQNGALGLALEAGATGQNLTEWQYGLASTRFRWNVSGTYQQVIPRYISTAADGSDEREFLPAHFPDMQTLTTAIFLKGYQWPFDPRKLVAGGSSLIDLLVSHETLALGRRVFLDFRRNPSHGGQANPEPFSLDALGEEARAYLAASGALLPTPIERLAQMNPAALALYGEHGIDLRHEPLEIAVCAQHHNGGLQGNIWWESNLRHFFPIGEANGSHGVYRPGGAALNAGQCGGMRAAQYIAAQYRDAPPVDEVFAVATATQVAEQYRRVDGLLCAGGGQAALRAQRARLQARMSAHGAHLRRAAGIAAALDEARAQLAAWEGVGVSTASELPEAFVNRDALLAQIACLSAMQETIARGGVSRGSYLVLDAEGTAVPVALGDRYRYRAGDDPLAKVICETTLAPDGSASHTWTPCRPIPDGNGWFESVWTAYREGRVIRRDDA